MAEYCYFKYRAINKNLIDSLVRSVLYFPTKAQLNDPFGCGVDLTRAINNALKLNDCGQLAPLREFQAQSDEIRRFQENISRLGIGSFSLTSQETLMWSHYAHDHRGLVLQYNFPYDFLNDEHNILGVSKVSYGENTISTWLRDNGYLYQESHFDFITELLKVFLTAKAPAWGYEQEARIIRPVAGQFNIPRTMLTQVIFGLRTSTQDEQLVRELIDSYYDRVKLGRVVPTGDDFGIKLVEI